MIIGLQVPILATSLVSIKHFAIMGYSITCSCVLRYDQTRLVSLFMWVWHLWICCNIYKVPLSSLDSFTFLIQLSICSNLLPKPVYTSSTLWSVFSIFSDCNSVRFNFQILQNSSLLFLVAFFFILFSSPVPFSSPFKRLTFEAKAIVLQ